MEAWREELYHFGIPKQRWGVRHGPPYPLDPEDHSAAQKKASGGVFKKMAEKRAEKKRKQKAAERVKKMQEGKQRAAEEKAKQEEYEKEKQRVLREGSAEDVMKYQGKLTNQELNDAYNRLNAERNIRNLITKPEQVSTTPVNQFPKEQINTGNNGADKGLKKLGKEKVPKPKKSWREVAKQASDDANTVANLTQNTTKAAKNTVFAINTGISIYNAYALAHGGNTVKKIRVDWSGTSEGGKKKDKDD